MLQSEWTRTGRRVVATVVITLVAMLVTSTQAFAATAHIYNPMSLSNTVASTYGGHPITYFSGWLGRDVRDLNSPDEYADAPIYGYGAGWSTANVLGSPNGPIPWMVYRIINNVCTARQNEYAIAFALNLSGGQVAGYSVSHLSNYHYAVGAPNGPVFNQGAQIANFSILGNESYLTFSNNTCTVKNTEGGAHIHAEWAHKSPVTFSAIDPVSGPSNYPYWYYNYP